jgi:hypothetical protein
LAYSIAHVHGIRQLREDLDRRRRWAPLLVDREDPVSAGALEPPTGARRPAGNGSPSLIPVNAVAPLAHLGHWYLWIPYVIPVLVVLAASFHAFRQQRREDRDGEQAEKTSP